MGCEGGGERGGELPESPSGKPSFPGPVKRGSQLAFVLRKENHMRHPAPPGGLSTLGCEGGCPPDRLSGLRKRNKEAIVGYPIVPMAAGLIFWVRPGKASPFWHRVRFVLFLKGHMGLARVCQGLDS